ncbi:uncharacterized protein LOC129777009 isoform X2 [Toxorhynchites rutilus septentrionalis]|nr:uncharacterized protein LOC129777009 isoform X2 [Toxorhynchites rutilus septentrionalis]XP_055639011.1 uncharacterized protein LOC129777009 isoform X2 [Toxorhynchites rutilus septentrionalis]XP_055639012.1 uncharacterized protein LOC129777009 isoform X2 [Toxorhynchites rutilus septentrionalis]
MDWSNELILDFIQLYEMHPILWDPRHKYHKNRNRLFDAWQNIANNIGIIVTVEGLRKKKESLMARYRALSKKVRLSSSSGSGAKDVYVPSWFAYAAIDRFIKARIQKNQLLNSEDSEDQEGQKDSRAHIQSRSSTRLKTSSKVTKIKKFKSSKSLRTKSSKRTLWATPGSSSTLAFARTDIKDEHSSYGEHIAIRLRSLPPRTRFLVQQSFNQMLFDAENGIYEQDSVPKKS